VRKEEKKVVVKKDKMVDIKVPPQRGLCLLSSIVVRRREDVWMVGKRTPSEGKKACFPGPKSRACEIVGGKGRKEAGWSRWRKTSPKSVRPLEKKPHRFGSKLGLLFWDEIHLEQPELNGQWCSHGPEYIGRGS
jgi:hypothetical protein